MRTSSEASRGMVFITAHLPPEPSVGWTMMLLAELVTVSNRVGSTRARLEKSRMLAELLRQATPDEVAIAVAYLSGALPQRKIGLGYATIHRLAETPAAGT